MPITFTNHFNGLLDDLVAFFQTEFGHEVAIIKGDAEPVSNQPMIIIEPLSKDTDSEVTNAQKKMTFQVAFFCTLWDGNASNGVIQITQLAERLEQLLLNNKKYPDNSGASWVNSFPGRSEYGIRKQGGHFLKASRITWTFDKWATR